MPKEFLTVKRRDPQYRESRTADYRDVEIRPDAATVREQSKRCMGCGIPFCHAYGCPLGNNIPDFNAAVREGRDSYAYEILSQTSPFPEFTSRICPALCESACCAGLPSRPVTVKQIEYHTIESAFANGVVRPRIPRNLTGKRVAVIGAGPSGLACADRLRSLGHEVCVFEKHSFAGGLLRYGIPDFKLEKHVIERRISLMRQAGIIFEFDTEIGKDVSADYIKKRFDAVCLCIGCETPRDIKIKGRELGGIHYALEFLGSQNRFNSGENLSLEISAKGKNVLIIGGGDTGSDCLGTAIRQGAKSVVQIEIMPEPPAERDASTPWPMWEYKKRTSSSHLEGGERMWSIASKEFAGKDGKVRALRAAKLKWEIVNGRPKSFAEIPDTEFEIPADLVLLSMGFTGVPKSGIAEELSLELAERGGIKTAGNMSTSADKIFACGDAVSGPSLVVRAIASGIKLAYEVDKAI